MAVLVSLLHLQQFIINPFGRRLDSGAGLRPWARHRFFHPSCEPAAAPIMYRTSRFREFKCGLVRKAGPPRLTSTEEACSPTTSFPPNRLSV